jgi:hypothetical protein
VVAINGIVGVLRVVLSDALSDALSDLLSEILSDIKSVDLSDALSNDSPDVFVPDLMKDALSGDLIKEALSPTLSNFSSSALEPLAKLKALLWKVGERSVVLTWTK